MAFGWMKLIYFKIYVCIVTGKRYSSGVILKYLRNHLYCDDRHGHSTMRWKISRETRFPGLLTLATNDNFRDERVYRMQIANTWRKRASTIRLGVFFFSPVIVERENRGLFIGYVTAARQRGKFRKHATCPVCVC